MDQQELTDAELEHLHRLARTARPGPWHWHDAYTLVDSGLKGVLTHRRNRDYIAAVPPELVLRLIDEVRFLRRLEQIRASTTPPPRQKSSRPAAKR